jgi:hypothetical protein
MPINFITQIILFPRMRFRIYFGTPHTYRQFIYLTPFIFRTGASAERLPHVSGHESPRTTKLYDRTKERFIQDGGGWRGSSCEH